MTKDNWNEYKDIMAKLELNFHPTIRSEEKDYLEILSEENITKVAVFDTMSIGAAIGFPLETDDMDDYFIAPELRQKKLFYLFKINVDRAFQGKGFGQQLLSELAKAAALKGYDKMVGHFRKNASLAMMKKFGAVEKEAITDWEGTGEDFVFCELDLAGFTAALPEENLSTVENAKRQASMKAC
ncbi:GNAT family N-acetyltransferase [Candidatus Woesearchaeota archaeon]|nr:GNAT family N-acetyltransferase [Candidatus Woesearchaeota archaeon]